MTATALARLAAQLDNVFMTSLEQAEAARADGNFMLRACPGAGKTHTVGLRLARLAAEDSDRSIAAVSHTNVAVDAIKQVASRLVPLPDHYFIGTAHTFLLTYVVYPFGFLYMKCKGRPEVAAASEDWPSAVSRGVAGNQNLRYSPWEFDVRLDRRMAFTQRPRNWPANVTIEEVEKQAQTWVRDEKRKLWKDGLMSFSDVLWVATRVLEENEQLAEALGARFSEIVIDEAQDTSELQLRPFELLRGAAEPPDLVLVGDLDQGVYEWGGATPESLSRFTEDQGLRELSLTRNYRSSQVICDTAVHWSTRPKADRASGEHASYDRTPEIWKYAKKELPGIAERFRELLVELTLEESHSAILVRSRNTADRINGARAAVPKVRWALRRLGEQAARRDDDEPPTKDGLRAIERALLWISLGSTTVPDLTVLQREVLRDASVSVWAALPKLQGDLYAWNEAARGPLTSAIPMLTSEPRRSASQLLKGFQELRGCDAREALEPPPPALARTIHSAKGESHAATLLVATESNLSQWLEEVWLDSPPESTSEETRVAYVALTRPQRFLGIAVPDDAPADQQDKLVFAGFTHA